ncbi:MAG: hypothetical protein K9W43_14320 [Candidatus Thorarchaeota archaeon]|nr:hypothetical protein [Candidatus Thorarchaeota archaeon]
MTLVVDGEEIRTYERLKIISQLSPVKEKIKQFERKHGCSLSEFKKRISEQKESFSLWDEYIEWKAYMAKRKDLEQQLREVEDAKNIRIAREK